ncbi:MAG: FecR domain-containing protein [Chthoniobacterales bacterium]
MKSIPKHVGACFCVASLFCSPIASGQNARVTQVVREVKLLPANAAARPASLNDEVREGIALRTGDRSRSELTFPDVTITRLGANSIFAFDQGGHSVNLEGGSVLLRVPKNSGGGSVRTTAITVAVTGTTLIVEGNRSGRSKLMVLEGSARLSLVKYPSQSRDVAAGQELDVPAGARTLGMPRNIDLNQVMKSHPLITGFGPLPSRDLILAAAQNPSRPGPPDEPIYQGQPVEGDEPSGAPAISIGLGGFPGGIPGAKNPGRKPGRHPGSDTRYPSAQRRPTPKPTPQTR